MKSQEKVEAAQQRAQKKVARRVAFIQEVAEAVVNKIAESVTSATAEQPIVNIAGMWLYDISKESRARVIAATDEVSPSAPAQS